MKKNIRNIEIDRAIYLSMSKYIEEATEKIKNGVCQNCPVVNEHCQYHPCQSAYGLIMQYANNQIISIAAFN